MTITKTSSGQEIVLSLAGRLDTTTSPQLAGELDTVYGEGARSLVFDLKELDYISSAGLRVLLIAQKRLSAQGGTVAVTGAAGSVREVMDITGFSEIFGISPRA
jgi:anti-sigma B factor antagonist